MIKYTLAELKMLQHAKDLIKLDPSSSDVVCLLVNSHFSKSNDTNGVSLQGGNKDGKESKTRKKAD